MAKANEDHVWMDFCIGWSAVATWLASQSSNAKLQGCDAANAWSDTPPQWRGSYCARWLIALISRAGHLDAVRPDLSIITISPPRVQIGQIITGFRLEPCPTSRVAAF
jgi:hypothetical protein